jgi:hypothetical protein
MDQTVERIPFGMQEILKPKPERYLGIGVARAHGVDREEDRDKDIREIGKLKPMSGPNQ